MTAKISFIKIAIKWKPLKRPNKMLKIANAKYNFAGVQSFSNSFEENIIILYIYIIFKFQEVYLNFLFHILNLLFQLVLFLVDINILKIYILVF